MTQTVVKYLWATVGLLLLLAPQEGLAQGERLGAVVGTYQACRDQLAPLARKLAAAEGDADIKNSMRVGYLRRRMVVEKDKCARLGDAPTNAVLEVIQLHQDLGQNTRALEVALRFRETFGDLPDLNFAIGRLLYKAGQKARGVKYLQRVLDARPTDVGSAELLGAYYYGTGELSRSIAYLRVVVQSRGEQFGANAALGDACLAQGDLECASTFLGRASELQPNDALLAVRVGDLHRVAKRPDLAIASYELALKTDPQRLRAWMGLGYASRDLQHNENAEAAFVQAAAIAPDSPETAIEASRSKRANGRALPSQLEWLVGKGRTPADVHIEYQMALLAANQIDKALTQLEKTPEDIKQDPRFLAVAGDTYVSAKNFQEALMQYRGARRSSPSEPLYLLREARALRHLDRPAEAVTLLERNAPATDPILRGELIDSLYDSARDLVQHGEQSAAASVLRRASTLAPNDADVLLGEAVVAVSQGDFAQARDRLDSMAPTEGRAAVEAWIAYGSRQYGEASRLARAAFDAGHNINLLVLQADALIRAGEPRQALAVLKAIPASVACGSVPEFHDKALSDALRDDVNARRFDQAAKLIATEGSAEASTKNAAEWLRRIPAVIRAATAMPLSGVDVYQKPEPVPSRKKTLLPIDNVLLALSEIVDNEPQNALKRLKSIPESDAAKTARVWANIEAASQSFKAGRRAEAVSFAKRVADTEDLSDEARFNVAVALNGASARTLAAILPSYLDKKIPAAYYDLALVVDSANRTGQLAIESLAKLLALSPAPPQPIRARAEALLEIKRRLY